MLVFAIIALGGIPKIYADIIRGESLIICSLAAIFFGLFRSNTTYTSMYRELYIFIGVFLDVFGSIICGYWCAKIIQHMLTDPFSNTMTDIIFCLSMVYMTFYIDLSCTVTLRVGVSTGLRYPVPDCHRIGGLSLSNPAFALTENQLTSMKDLRNYVCEIVASSKQRANVFTFVAFVQVRLPAGWEPRDEVEFLGMSGILALVTVGLNLDSLSFRPRSELIITKFLVVLSSAYQHLTYAFFGIVIGCGEIEYINFHTIVFILILFVTVNFARQIIMQNIIQHINEIIQSTITLSKTEKLLTNVNWNFVEEKSKIEYINPVSDDEEEEEESPTDAVLIEEARLPVAMMQISSFEKQCHDEVLEIEAARILIGAAKRYCPIQGRSSKFLILVYHIVFSEEFEYTGHIMTLLYIYPMIMHLWPMARELNVSALISINYYFVFFYVIRSALKVIIPVLKNIADVQLQKHLSLMYCVTKGYVKSLEDAKLLIKQISGRESVYQKLYEILETNQQDAIKELGLMEHENRDVVIAAKTKLVIRNVISDSLKDLAFLRSRGIIDKYEGIEIKTALFKKLKVLENFPMAIPPPAPHEYLHNFIWLENEDLIIDFFRDKVTLACFDYGDIICREGEMPTGIYLIISGMAILRGSPPSFGVESSQRPDRESKTMFTEYCTSGDIIGELSCLLKHEIEYTAICETVLEACFISMEDLYEGFDAFWPFLEHKIWLKLALSIAHKYFESSISNEDLEFQKCVTLKHAYVETLSSDNEMVINNMTMKLVILVYGSVIDTMTEQIYLAPCIIPKTCEQVQGIADLTKLLVIRVSEPSKKSNTPVMDHRNWKRAFLMCRCVASGKDSYILAQIPTDYLVRRLPSSSRNRLLLHLFSSLAPTGAGRQPSFLLLPGKRCCSENLVEVPADGGWVENRQNFLSGPKMNTCDVHEGKAGESALRAF
ncbi:Sodium/hydrogen exchanger 11 [Tupaia chinensis]|uniref:Sodium/hydrogen exchanger 11 n=1 Tax=Tupaia chinensis TaxID=246437 RepID=L9JGX7_TUPCH|nr:Sodium/hydrogen exchanger 11 [Tupaia chinensis]